VGAQRVGADLMSNSRCNNSSLHGSTAQRDATTMMQLAVVEQSDTL
jgi:hypothetical protein